MEDSGKLHEDFLWLDTVAQICDDLVKLILVYFLFRVVEALDEPAHDLPEVLLIFGTQHANQIDDLLDQLWELEVYRTDQRQKDILIVVNQFVVEVFEEDDVPVNYNLLGGRMALVELYKKQIRSKSRMFSTYHWVLVNLEFILKFLQDILKVALFLHYF